MVRVEITLWLIGNGMAPVRGWGGTHVACLGGNDMIYRGTHKIAQSAVEGNGNVGPHRIHAGRKYESFVVCTVYLAIPPLVLSSYIVSMSGEG